MVKYKHYTFSVLRVIPKETAKVKPSYWFQKGKLTPSADYSKNISSGRGFRTQRKFLSFLIWLETTYPDTYVQVAETRNNETIVFYVVMGKDWKEYYKEYIK